MIKKFGSKTATSERAPRKTFGRDEAQTARSGPRARAAQQNSYGDPFQRASRPARSADDRGERSRSAVITLDADVALAFRTSEAVNAALRLVVQLGRLSGGARPSFRPAAPRATGDRSAFAPSSPRKSYDSAERAPRKAADAGDAERPRAPRKSLGADARPRAPRRDAATKPAGPRFDDNE